MHASIVEQKGQHRTKRTRLWKYPTECRMSKRQLVTKCFEIGPVFTAEDRPSVCPVQFKRSSALRQCTSTKAVIFVTDGFRLPDNIITSDTTGNNTSLPLTNLFVVVYSTEEIICIPQDSHATAMCIH